MITAEKLTFLTTLTPTELAKVVDQKGSSTTFKDVKFVGITFAGEFCYKVTYPNEEPLQGTVNKVFLQYDAQRDELIAYF